MASFQRSQRWLHRLFVVFLPGADHCFVGATWVGCAEYGFFCFALGLVLATGRSVRYPGEILADPASTWLPVGLTLLAILLPAVLAETPAAAVLKGGGRWRLKAPCGISTCFRCST